MRSRWGLLSFALWLTAFPSLASVYTYHGATSPDGRLSITMRYCDQCSPFPGPQYNVMLDGETIVAWSDMGVVVEWVDQTEPAKVQRADFTHDVGYGERSKGRVDDSYTMVTGKRRENRYTANTATWELQDYGSGLRMDVELQAADDGVAFRYVLKGESAVFHTVVSEATEFSFADDDPQLFDDGYETGGTHWGQPYDTATVWQPAYETPWTRGVPLGTPPGIDVDNDWEEPTLYPGWAMPSLFRNERGTWILIGETDVTRDFHGSHLTGGNSDGVFSIKPPLAESGLGFGRNVAAAPLPMEMPWRFILASDDLGNIVESNRVHDLATPNVIGDTSWIAPGLVSWSWWSDHASSRSATAMLPFIDLAAEMGWPYSLIDANWNTISDTAMEDLVAYADGKGVKLLFWYNSGGRHNAVTEAPRNIMSDRERRRAEFAKLQRLGVAGVKVDFFHSDKQDRIAQYLDILEDAAEYELLVNFHGSTMPRGWQRTYPNLMTMESVRGSEAYTFASAPNYGELAVWQNTVLPFTRNVVGSMDYTPVNFSDEFTPHVTTFAHEAALGVLFESGLQHLSDSVESYRSMSEDYRDYLKSLPVVWDETRYLAGEPGTDAVIARRSGERWWVAGINGTREARSFALELSELEGFVGTRAVLLYDGEDAMDFTSRTVPVTAKMEVRTAPAGGFVLVPGE